MALIPRMDIDRAKTARSERKRDKRPAERAARGGDGLF